MRTSNELAGSGITCEDDGRVPSRAATKHGWVGAGRSFDEHLFEPADTCLVVLARQALGHLDEALHALDLQLVRHGIGHRRGLGARTGRVDERERTVVAHLLDDLQRLCEVGFGLAREADDDVGAEREIGDCSAHLLGQGEVALARVRTPHRLQDSRRAGLERQVHVLAHGVALGDRCDHRLAEVLRMRARETNPLDAFDRVARAQQLAELGLDVGDKIAAPGVDVLAEQCQLAHAVAGEARHLGEDLAGPPRHLAPTDGRHDAVGALGVAAHRDLHPGLEGAFAVHWQLGREVAVVEPEPPTRDAHTTGAEPLAEMGDRAGPNATSTAG